MWVFILLRSTILLAQTGTIKIKLIDKETKEFIPFANVVVFSNDAQIGGAVTNMRGEAIIKPIVPGKYTLKITYVGYQPVERTEILVSASKTADIDIELSTQAIELKMCTIRYDKPLIRWSGCGSCCSIEDFRALPSQKMDTVLNSDNEKIDNNKSNSFKYYPNPTNGPLFVETEDNVRELFLVDISGKLIQKYPVEGITKTEINLTGLAPGAYFLQYFSNEKPITGKIVLMP